MGGMSLNASVIESENAEEESDEEDQEARDQTEEQTQVEDQVEERTFHHQQGDGSQGTGADAKQEARKLHSRRRQRNTETGRSERVEDRENISAARECESVLAWLRGRLKFN